MVVFQLLEVLLDICNVVTIVKAIFGPILFVCHLVKNILCDSAMLFIGVETILEKSVVEGNRVVDLVD